MDWNDLRYFLALARLGSVRAAGTTLGVSHSTVARRVEALETQLHTRLFDRSQDGYTLTAAGRDLLPRAERVEGEVADLERALLGQDERLEGVVTVTCGDPFVSQLLMKVLGDFCTAHPGIELRFTVDGRPYDLARREADVAVRALGVGVNPPEYLLGTKVAPILLAGYVAVEHAARLNPAREATPARWLSFEDRKMVEYLIAGSGYPTLPPWGAFGSIEAMIQAVRAGLGLALLPVYIGDQVPDLQRLAHPGLRPVGDLWLLSHPDLRHTARVKAVRAVVSQAFRDQAGLFQGWSNSAPGRPDFEPSPTAQGRLP